MACAAHVVMRSLEEALVDKDAPVWDDESAEGSSAKLPYNVEDIELPGPTRPIVRKFATAHVLKSGVLGRVDRTGFVEWSGTRLGAVMLSRISSAVKGRSVIEFGCGTGLLSAAAAALEARVAVPTDADPEAAVVAVHNARSQNQQTIVCGHRLIWGDAGDEEALVNAHGRFDLGVAAEVLYIFRSDPADANIEDKCASLLLCAGRLLSEKGVLLIVYKPRYPGMGPSIRRAAARVGWSMVPISRDHVLASRYDGEPRATGHGRIVAFAPTAAALDSFLADTGLRLADPSDEEDHVEIESEESFFAGLAGAVDD